jgi:hypothetical protein
MKTIVKYIKKLALLGAMVLAGGSALAGQPGASSLNDVKLGGLVADDYVYRSGLGSSGSVPADFSSALYGTGVWTTIGSFGAAADNNLPLLTSTALGLNFSMSFDQIDSRHGTWTIKNNDSANNVQLDLVFGLSGTGGNGAWLFDNQVINAGQTLSGSWDIKFYNGNPISTYSGLNLFARDVSKQPLVTSPVPEPETYLMLLAGLGIVLMSRRRKDEHEKFN